MTFQRGVVSALLIAAVVSWLFRSRFRPENLQPDLKGKVAVVTGGSRGIGKGIAVALGEAGATVYITGRSLKKSSPPDTNKTDTEGSLEETCKLVTEAGGECIPLAVDNTDDRKVQGFLNEITKKHGHISVLVNNAFSGVSYMEKHVGEPFWQKGPEAWDAINKVGLRSHYVASSYGAALMSGMKPGLIVNVGSFGGLSYIVDVAYGIGKAAMDRMAADMAIELETKSITMVSVWPGLVQAEKLQDGAIPFERLQPRRGLAPGVPQADFGEMFNTPLAETPLFVGRTLAALARDRSMLQFSGKVLIPAVMASGYGIVDERGVRSPPFTSVKFMASYLFKSFLQYYDLWKVPEELFAKHPPVSESMNFYWNKLPDFTFPSFLVKLTAGAPNL